MEANLCRELVLYMPVWARGGHFKVYDEEGDEIPALISEEEFLNVTILRSYIASIDASFQLQPKKPGSSRPSGVLPADLQRGERSDEADAIFWSRDWTAGMVQPEYSLACQFKSEVMRAALSVALEFDAARKGIDPARVKGYRDDLQTALMVIPHVADNVDLCRLCGQEERGNLYNLFRPVPSLAASNISYFYMNGAYRQHLAAFRIMRCMNLVKEPREQSYFWTPALPEFDAAGKGNY
ncbi:hypothetical protein B0H13DRAFT_1885485 [Mycena leptocephala]|nr:hypothetical protein B0H13DRAFT_1885485 [Mycena leptocephala]